MSTTLDVSSRGERAPGPGPRDTATSGVALRVPRQGWAILSSAPRAFGGGRSLGAVRVRARPCNAPGPSPSFIQCRCTPERDTGVGGARGGAWGCAEGSFSPGPVSARLLPSLQASQHALSAAHPHRSTRRMGRYAGNTEGQACKARGTNLRVHYKVRVGLARPRACHGRRLPGRPRSPLP